MRFFRPLPFYGPFTLPSVFDDALSYTEYLGKVVVMVNKLGDAVNELAEAINEAEGRIANEIDKALSESKSYTDSRISEIRKYVEEEIDALEGDVDERIKSIMSEMDSLRSEMQRFREQINADMDRFEDEIRTDADRRFKEMQTHFDDRMDSFESEMEQNLLAFEKEIHERLHEFENSIEQIHIEWNVFKAVVMEYIYDVEIRMQKYADTQRNIVEIKIKETFDYLKTYIDTVAKDWEPNVWDFTSGTWQNINTALGRLYNAMSTIHGIKAKEYDNLYLTAEEYDAMGITALEYDLKALLFLKEYLDVMFSPFTGKRQNWKEIVLQIAQILHWNGKTAEEYDSLRYTSEKFDSSDFNALEQDSNKQYHYVDKDFRNMRILQKVLLHDNDATEEYLETVVTDGVFDAYEIHFTSYHDSAYDYAYMYSCIVTAKLDSSVVGNSFSSLNRYGYGPIAGVYRSVNISHDDNENTTTFDIGDCYTTSGNGSDRTSEKLVVSAIYGINYKTTLN